MTFTLSETQFKQLKKITLARRYQLTKAQAKIRKQEWNLSLKDFVEIWSENNEQWLNIGRTADSLTMCRLDFDGAWTRDNVHVVTRKTMLAQDGRFRKDRPGRNQ